jgi:sortase A
MTHERCLNITGDQHRCQFLRRVLHTLQWISFVAGSALCTAYAVALTAGELGRRNDVAQFALAQAPASESREDQSTLADASPDQSLWSQRRVREFFATRSLPISEPLAVLHVPSLHLTVPIYPTTSELHLNRGVGAIAGMAALDSGGNLGVAGHRDGYFRALKDISTGSVIEVRTRTRVHRYRVVSIHVVDASDRRLLADTDDPTITLVTCYPFYYLGNAPRRFIVRGAYLWPTGVSSGYT